MISSAWSVLALLLFPFPRGQELVVPRSSDKEDHRDRKGDKEHASRPSRSLLEDDRQAGADGGGREQENDLARQVHPKWGDDSAEAERAAEHEDGTAKGGPERDVGHAVATSRETDRDILRLQAGKQRSSDEGGNPRGPGDAHEALQQSLRSDHDENDAPNEGDECNQKRRVCGEWSGIQGP
jgi:hypothetical protein